MQITFHKYQGTGNDFVIIDNRNGAITTLHKEWISRCCDRKFGIGADGLMLLQQKEGYDFEMIYYNADGQLSSMCGNGGRCITAFAQHLGILSEKKAYFLAVDGPHDAIISGSNYVELKMIDVTTVEQHQNFSCLNTGSPHYIQFVNSLANIDIYQAGKQIRYSPAFEAEGINVNFVEIKTTQSLEVATYERGVEAETLSCGTGVTAAALAYHTANPNTKSPIHIKTKGGDLHIKFDSQDGHYSDIWLCGAATPVFTGQINF